MVNRLFRKQHPNVGARPGTLAISSQSPPPVVRIIDFQGERLSQRQLDSPDELRSALNADSVTWVDVQGFGDKSFFNSIGEIFDLHPLLLEDIVNVPQRPKTESYGDQLLIIVRMVRLNEEDHQFEMEQVSFVVGKNYVLTFQECYGDVFDPVRERARNPEGRIRQGGADYLTYALIDTVVDAYYPALERIGDHLESMEDRVIESPTPGLLAELHHLKNRLVNLRRGIWPQREAISSLARDDNELISDDVRVFFRDVQDHCIQASEVAEMYREMVTGLMNTYLSSVANKTNEVMKVLTIVSTVFIPMTFIAGVYGMNFSHMPELQYAWSYPIVWLVMLVTGITMMAFFWRCGWIGSLGRRSR